jgi:hypothetical protein
MRRLLLARLPSPLKLSPVVALLFGGLGSLLARFISNTTTGQTGTTLEATCKVASSKQWPTVFEL